MDTPQDRPATGTQPASFAVADELPDRDPHTLFARVDARLVRAPHKHLARLDPARVETYPRPASTPET